MRNLINYYYQLEPTDIRQTNGYVLFEVDGSSYQLLEIDDMQESEVYQLQQEMYKRGIYTHQMIPTTNGNLSVPFHEKQYVLLKLYGKVDTPVTIELIDFFQTQVKYISLMEGRNTSNWGELWSKKIDYFEYQMSQLGVKYKKVTESFTYYVGLAEVGISLFYMYYEKEQALILSHKRLTSKNTLLHFYNPFSFVLDIRSRDSAEYFKSLYVKENNIIAKVKDYLEQANYTEYEKMMFFIRLFFPSFYFDLFEEVITGREEETKIDEIIKKTSNYHHFLSEVYEYLGEQINMPYIPWLKKSSITLLHQQH